MYKVSVSPKGKLYARRVVTNGRVQQAFKDQIGKSVGDCYHDKVYGKAGDISRSDMIAAMKSCSVKKGMKLNGNFIHNDDSDATRKRARRRAYGESGNPQ